MEYYGNNGEISLILADDHEVVRAGIRRLLSINQKIRILDEAVNGEEALSLVKYYKPDVILLDIMMPIMNGIVAGKLIKEALPDILVVILTAYDDKEHIEQALAIGADAYLTKDITAKSLIESLEKIVQGERVFSKSIINCLQQKISNEQDDSIMISLTSREAEILNEVASGKTSPEIAEEFNISVRTVQSHRSNIMQKLGIKNTAGLIRFALTKTQYLSYRNRNFSSHN